MADSGALRAQRARAHKAGDHSLCVAGRCPAAGPASAAPAPRRTASRQKRERKPVETATPAAVEEPPPDTLPEPGGIEKATTAFIESLPFSDDDNDPRTLQGQICIMLARRIDQSGAMPAVVRELRTMLNQISEVPSQAAGPVDDARYHRAMRRFETILSRL